VGEISGPDNHFIDTAGCSKVARDRLVELSLDDTAELYSLHVNGRQRIIGIRDRQVLKILWYDPDHQVYPSRKKGT
jgi:hypothetical protein